MSKVFDRTDYESRSLKACYRELGDRLSDEAAALRSELHEKHYPGFGAVGGAKKRAIAQQLRQWHEIFRDYAERLFRLSFEVEEKLVNSIALERKTEHREFYERVRTRKAETDQILRAVHAKLRHFATMSEIDTEAVYDFCMLAHRAAQYFQFTSLVLFATPGDERLKDPVFRDTDWQDLDRLGKHLPSAIRAHYTTYREPPPEAVEVESVPVEPVIVEPSPRGAPPGEPATTTRRSRRGGTPPADAAARLERMRRAPPRRRS
ncbi:MAG TPA: hypothetical protein VMB81_25370 [Candidatus Sulfotelmatobacter sp.]|nr:hypothetical protein [Candidatus Sulfotelmatobacter sp.]